jgi:hypothetical protein
MPNMQGLAGSGEYSHLETAREYARFSTEVNDPDTGRVLTPAPGGHPPIGLIELTVAFASKMTLKSSRLATFPVLVHTQSRLILLSRINGDAPRA